MDILSQNLKRLREERGMEQAVAAAAVNVSRSSYSAYENGTTPPANTLMKIASFFGVSTDFLLGMTYNRQPMSGDLDKQLTQLIEISKGESFSSKDLSSLLSALIEYYKSGSPAGSAPMDSIRAYISAMCNMLDASVAEDIADLITSANAVASAGLSANSALQIMVTARNQCK